MKQRSRTSTVPSCTSSPRYSTELIFVLQSVFGLILIRSLILSLIFKKNCVTTEPQSTQTSSSKHTSSTGISRPLSCRMISPIEIMSFKWTNRSNSASMSCWPLTRSTAVQIRTTPCWFLRL